MDLSRHVCRRHGVAPAGLYLVLSLGTAVAQRYVTRMKGLDRYLRRIAGAIFLVAGLNDTLTYWAF